MTTPATTTDRPDRQRLTERDADYLRLRNITARRLTRSVARLVRDLRHPGPGGQTVALHDFIGRQTAILQDAYVASVREGARDYFQEVSATPEKWAKGVSVNPERMRAALAFYAPSIAKMAHEALQASTAAPQVKLEELIADAEETVKLFSFFAPRIGARPTGGFGGGADRATYGPHHQFTGSRSTGQHEQTGHESQRGIQEHLAAHRGEEGGGGASRRGENAGARRIERASEHIRAIQRVAAAHANPALHAEERIHQLRHEAETATEAFHAAANAAHEVFIQRSAAIRGDLIDHPTARIRDLANRAARAEAAAHGPKAAALEGRMRDLGVRISDPYRNNPEEMTRMVGQLDRIRRIQDARTQVLDRARAHYRNAVTFEVQSRLAVDPAYRHALEHEERMDAARRQAVEAHGQLRQDYLNARNELYRAQRNLESIQQHARLGAARAAHVDTHGAPPFTQEQFVAALRTLNHAGVNTGVNSTGVAKINRREYIVKRITMTDSRGDAEAQAAREVVTPQIGRLLGVGENMPAAAYHLTHEGEHYIVVTREAGRAVASHDAAVRSEIVNHYDGIAGQKLLMFEYLTGQGDRHEGNILYSEHNHHLTEIDFGLEYPHGTALLERSVVGRALTHNGEIPMGDVIIHPSVLNHALSVHHEVIHAMANGGMHSHDINGVEQRFAVLHDLQIEMEGSGQVTMHDWWRLGGDHEDFREVVSVPWFTANRSSGWE